MLAFYPLDELKAYLAKHGRELHQNDPELPDALASEKGAFYLLPAAWAPNGQVVVQFPPTFPDTLPKIYLPKEARRPAVVAHVNRPGQICCFEPSTVVNGTSPLAVLNGVLAKAETIWSKQYSPEALLTEVEMEFTAYWENGEYNPLFICDAAVDNQRVLGVVDEVLASKRTVHRLAAIDSNTTATVRIALVAGVPRERLIELLTDPHQTLLALTDLSVALETLRSYLAKGTLRKRILEAWIVLRCETAAGDVFVGLQVVNRFGVDLRKGNFATESHEWLVKSAVRRVAVQDVRIGRLRARTAGREQRQDLAYARLTLAGCGSLGGFVADGLARAGVRHWLLLDSDVFRPENIARHLLNFDALYLPKAEAVGAALKRRFADLDVDTSILPIQTDAAKAKVEKFGPTLVLSATGDTSTDLTLSEECRRGHFGDCCFLWVEPNLAAGHLVFQPRGSAVGLHDLHEQIGPDAYYYLYRVLADPRSLHQMEMGCQVAFTPYSGADMQEFAHASVIKVANILRCRPNGLVVLRFKESKWETIPI
jgi:hypothetical protein